MGWNSIDIRRDSTLLKGIPTNSAFYFVHSYHVCCNGTNSVAATTNYGYDFTSVIEKENVFGVQFHPEKSHKNGIKLKVPHMGWNSIDIRRDSTLLKGIPTNSTFYFVHSYHVCCNGANSVAATTNYGYDFVSVIEKENVFGTQFHPEKSHKNGVRLLKNFVECV
jgi:imidazoleglycerol phosphate synthase glutamine amidotransferase subunit HisH